MQLRDSREILRPRIAPPHFLEHAVAPRLDRQMQMAADLRTIPIGGDQFVRTPARMRARKADALDAVDLLSAPQQLREALVAKNALPEERHFLYAPRRQALDLTHDIVRRPRILMPPHFRHNAITAAVVTTGHHRDKSLKAASRVSGQRITALHKRNLQEFAGRDSEIQLRKLLEQRIPKPLHRAAHHADDLAVGNQVPRLADRLLFRLLPYGAAVDDDELRLRLSRDLLVPRLNKQRLDRFRVADVHLTAVGMDQKLHLWNYSIFHPNTPIASATAAR